MRLIKLAVFTAVVFVSIDACCKNKDVGQCCGNGKCNIFCCNCDNGCNKECETNYASFVATGLAAAALVGRKRRDVGLNSLSARRIRSAERFAAVDADNNGAVTLEEAAAYLEFHNVIRRDIDGASPSWFTTMDTNNDGLISPSEFDFSLAY